MSKILRRPMFRGGGTVSSYGKGIAAPLVPGYQMGGRIPGYQMGGNVSGGIVDLPGGYALTGNERLADLVLQKQNLNLIPTLPSAQLASQNMMLGSEILAKAKGRMTQNDAVRGVVNNTKSKDVTENEESDAQLVASLTGDDGQGGMEGEFETVTKEDGIGSDTSTTNDAVYGTVKNYIGAQQGLDESTKALFRGVLEGNRGINEEYRDAKNRETVGGRDLDFQARGMSEEDYKKSKADAATNSAKKVTDLLTGEGSNELGESTQISAKDAIRENQELFKELLGSKKARGQDISDMLLRFSGSQGNTLGEKFQNYTRAESAAGPGRGEKINQTAAALAINDYVAGKRSKEQAEVLKGKIDYEYGKKGQMVDVQAGDDVQTALFKIAKKGDVKPNSDAALKYLIGMKDQTANGNKVYRQDKLDIDDLEDKQGNVSKKAKKRLKVGYNIIEEDGVKNIVTWDGTNYNILTIGEIWTG